jgi:lysozyme family protein
LTTFELAFAAIIGLEGGLTLNPADSGNWTGGRCNVGECRGTHWGISAAAYPTLDIGSLTMLAAQAIYIKDYWRPLAADEFPPELALMLFDAGVNNGIDQAARWLQQIVEVPQDGRIGPMTIGAVHAGLVRQGCDVVCAEYLALRLWEMTRLGNWRIFGRGWSRRLCKLPYLARAMTTPDAWPRIVPPAT